MDHERNTSAQTPIGQATPGPWRVHGKFIVAGDHVTICQWINYTDDADALLIAAAPDMLAALRDVVSSLETLGIDGWSDAPHLMNVCRSTIARATGAQ